METVDVFFNISSSRKCVFLSVIRDILKSNNLLQFLYCYLSDNVLLTTVQTTTALCLTQVRT